AGVTVRCWQRKRLFCRQVLIGLRRPPSPFDKLRVRTTVTLGAHKILFLSLSKDEDFHPRERPHSTRRQPRKRPRCFHRGLVHFRMSDA
ncbi:MAG: hypothetical protein B7Z12_21610, partial [Caulobacter vibrioides]